MNYTPSSSDVHDVFVRFKTGEKQAEQQLIAVISPWVRSIVRRRLCSAPNVDDVVQEILLALVCNLRRDYLREATSLHAYVRGIAVRKIADAISQMRRFTEISDIATIDPRESPEDFAEARQRQAALLDAVRLLSPRDREVLRRSYALDQSTEEIAAAMNLSATRIRYLRTRAVHNLARMFRYTSRKEYGQRAA